MEDTQKVEYEGKTVKQRQQKVLDLLKHLNDAKAEGKHRQDRTVQQIESDILKEFHISSESWISNDKSLEELIAKLEAHHEETSATLKSRGNLSEHMVLCKASGGRALKGIFCTKNIEDQIEDRDTLLKPLKTVELGGAANSNYVCKQFSAKGEEDTYRKSVVVLGGNFSVSGIIPVHKGVTVGVGMALTDKSDTHGISEDHHKCTFSSMVKHFSVQLASFSFKNVDLRLTDDVIEVLKELKSLVIMYGSNSSQVQRKSKAIFSTYGSHVNKGPLHFGGTYWLTCTSEGFSHNKRREVKDLQTEAIHANAGATFMGFGVSTEVNIDGIKKKYAGIHAGGTLGRSRLEVSVTGGSPAITSLPEWTACLEANNSTWIVTDRGKKFIPIWDVIKMNYYDELKETIAVLKQCWEDITGLVAEQDMFTTSYIPENVLKEVKSWTNQTATDSDINENIKYLLNVKSDLIKKTANQQAWANVYLSNESMQDFIEIVMKRCMSCEFEDVKFHMQQLIEEADLSKLTSRTFRNILDVSKWLHKSPHISVNDKIECKDFEMFINCLKEVKEKLEISRAGILPLHERSYDGSEAAKSVELALQSLRCELQKQQEMYDDILITTIIYPFKRGNSDYPISLRPLSLNDLDVLLKQLREQTMKYIAYTSQDETKVQAYLFHLAVGVYCTETDAKKEERQLKVQLSYMKNAIKDRILTTVERLLERYEVDECDFMTLKDDLSALMSDNQEDCPAMLEDDHSLQHVMTVASHQQSESNPMPLSQTNISSEDNPKAYELFQALNLIQYYPRMLKLKDALCITSKILDISYCQIPSQLSSLVLHKIMSCDYQCRSELLQVKKLKHNTHDHNEEGDSDTDADTDDNVDSCGEIDRKSDCDSSQMRMRKIHPVDCLLSLIYCADDFLRQDIFSRLAKCQLAIPFLLPDPFSSKLLFPLWAMRSIIKEWKCVSADGSNIEEKACSIVSYKMPIITFMRFGERQQRGYSKSWILNEVISDSHYDHFFHRDCEGGDSDLLLGDGLVDVCWYLPAGKSKDIFKDAVTFLNLHGDARQHCQQAEFLSRVSSMCFILITMDGLRFDQPMMSILKKFLTRPGGIVLLIDCNKPPLQFETELKVDSIKLLTKNAATTKKLIRRKVNKRMRAVEEFEAIEYLASTAHETQIDVDENEACLKEGFKKANTILKLLTQQGSTKRDMLPLQGEELWQKWASNDKEQHRQLNRGSKSVSAYSSHVQEQNRLIRKTQLRYVNEPTPVVKTFVTYLLNESPSDRDYFLYCLKLGLNNIFRDRISNLQFQYQRVRNRMMSLQIETKSDDDKAKVEPAELETCRAEIESLHKQLVGASLGLEHLLREAGQVYEAAEQSTCNTQFACLPKAAADLLIAGYPLEIMDGDAAHVPLHWISSVLKEAIKILDDPYVFVLSVLGLQSTGKSTLLNTAFGLQFNVSAGRCTRGAFMQLLPVDKNECECECDYVLVIDTEGLRAPELDSLKHDNELATFVIGLANVTFINIYGEVPGDMDDILQTSVHAFIRMRKVKLKPSCQFVHHNVGASQKGEMGRVKFTQKLNEMTCNAAKEERCFGQFEDFSDVINFNDQKDIHFFPALWKGDPPMAPVNQGYSESAQSLKCNLVNMVKSTKASSLKSFKKKLDDLWNALLHEKFVFSFKNTLEVTAYNLLEVEYSQWEWDFHKQMREWQQKLENKFRGTSSNKLSEFAGEMLVECRILVHSIHEFLKELMETFFKESKQSEILAQWQKKTELRLNSLAQELQAEAAVHCEQLSAGIQAIEMVKQEKKKYAKRITENVMGIIASLKQQQEDLRLNLEVRKLTEEQLQTILNMDLFAHDKLQRYLSQQLITLDQINIIQHHGHLTPHSLKLVLYEALRTDQVKQILEKGRLSEEQLENEFNVQWRELVAQLPEVCDIPIDVEKVVEQKLFAFVGIDDGAVIDRIQKSLKKLKEWGNPLRLEIIKDVHLERGHASLSQKVKRILFTVSESHQKQAQLITDSVLQVAKNHLKGIQNCIFNQGDTLELLRVVNATINENSNDSEDFVFTKTYRIDMYLTVCGYAVGQFEKMISNFRRQNNPFVHLEEEVRKPLFAMFKSQYYQLAQEKALANTLCEFLANPIVKQVKDRLCITVIENMRAADQCFKSKAALKARILIDLANNVKRNGNFCDYFLYLRNIKASIEQWIMRYTKQYCEAEEPNGLSRMQNLANQEVTDQITFLAERVRIASNAFTCLHVEKVSAKHWLGMFCGEKDILERFGVKLDISTFQVHERTELNLNNFAAEVRSGLNDLKPKLQKQMSTVDCDEMNEWRKRPQDYFKKTLIGCCEQCPFCKEQCDFGEHGDDINCKHRVRLHRPDCLGGMIRVDKQEMTVDLCTTMVGSSTWRFSKTKTEPYEWHPYNEYQTVFPYWSIPEDLSAKASSYWKWFVGKYHTQISEYFGETFTDIDPAWKKLTLDKVIGELKDEYSL
jgi:hypothetical protein